jgi:hypothetical protein
MLYKLLLVFSWVHFAWNAPFNLQTELKELVRLEKESSFSNYDYIIKFNDAIRRLISADPLWLVEELIKVRSIEEVLFFWMYNCDHCILSFFRSSVSITKDDPGVIRLVISNFKRFVLAKIISFKDSDTAHYREKFYEASIQLSFRLRRLRSNDDSLALLPRQYQMLIKIEPKSLIFSEFYRMKDSLAVFKLEKEPVRSDIHLELFFTLVNYFTGQEADLHGLLWVADFSPQFIFLFLFFHKNTSLFTHFQGDLHKVIHRNFIYLQESVMWGLNDLVPIFRSSVTENGINITFDDLNFYINPIFNDNELWELVQRITQKLRLVSEDNLL